METHRNIYYYIYVEREKFMYKHRTLFIDIMYTHKEGGERDINTYT